MRVQHWISSAVLIVLTGTILLGQPASARAQKKPGTPADPAIAYQKPVGGNVNLMVMNADGSNQRVVYNRGQSYTPNWSPDGKKLVFGNSGTGSGSGIYIINVDGTGLCKLAALNNTQAMWSSPAWSPLPLADGNYWIVYVDISGSKRDLFAVKANCSNPGSPVNLTNTTADEEWFPSWSRFANHIAVQLSPGGSTPVVAIYDVSVVGAAPKLSSPVLLTTLGLFPGMWTGLPDYGKADDRIVLTSTGNPGGINDLWVTDLTQSGTYDLSNSTDMSEYDSSWSPDGTAIVYYGIPLVNGQPYPPGAIYKLSYNVATGAWVRTMLFQWGNSSLYPKWRR
jgi:Tol biopolymer transport system component